MSDEVVALRARIARLERMLAASAVVAAVVAAAAMPIATRAAGPTRVTAPFTVVDDSGRALLEVTSTASGGRLVVFNSAQDRIAELQAVHDGKAGHLFIYSAGDANPRVMVGMNESGGALELAADDGLTTEMTGRGLVVADANRNPLAALRGSTDRGWVKLWAAGLPKIELWATGMGGRMSMYGTSGSDDSSTPPTEPPTALEAVTIEGRANGAGKITLAANEQPRATLGVSASDGGLIRLDAGNGNRAEMHGTNGSFRSLNPGGGDVAVIGVDGNGNGIVDVRHKSSTGGVRLDVSDTGAGNLKIHTPPFEIKAQIGTKGEKGDMCVEGGKGLICLSGVAIKSLIPW